MQTFGRMRLDVENCVGELVEFGVVRRQAGDPPKYIAGAARPGSDGAAARQLPRAARHRRHRRDLAIGPALPRDDRPRREDGRHLRVDSHRGQVRHRGADSRPDRLGQRARRADDSRAVAPRPGALPGGQLRGAARTRCSSRRSSATRRARSPALTIASPADSSSPTAARCLLDEIGDLSLVAQAKLLRVLEERRFERLGGNRSIHVDFRLISATNRPLDLFVREGRFREDLYYRINAFAIRLPSLRERAVDIPVLANRFLGRYCASNGLPLDAKQFSREADDLLISYHWPGNIRELESTVSRAALSAPGRVIRAADIEFLHGRLPQPESEPSSGSRRCATPSASTSFACSRPSTGTSSKRRRCSTSAAARSIARSTSSASNRGRRASPTSRRAAG